MKKRLLTSLLIMTMACSMVACGDKEAEENTDSTDTADTTEDVDYSYDVLDYVTLGDYKGIEVTLDGDYEYTDEGYQEYIAEQLGDDALYVEDDSQTEIKEDSIVNVDYVGSQDGVAFDGGSATDQMLDIAANGDTSGTSYIDGFTEGLVGHSVGEEVAYEVTFPESYGNADLAGQTVTFTFTVNYIARKTSVDEMSEEDIANQLGYETVDEYKETTKENYEQELADNKESDIRTCVINTVCNNATVSGLPDGILDGRVNLYIDTMESYYCTDGSTLQEFMESQGQDYDEFLTKIKSSLSDSLEQELVFEAIAKTEGIECDEDGFNEFVEKMYTSYNMSDAQTLYDSYTIPGFSGEDYIKNTYLTEKAVEFVVDNAVVNE